MRWKTELHDFGEPPHCGCFVCEKVLRARPVHSGVEWTGEAGGLTISLAGGEDHGSFVTRKTRVQSRRGRRVREM